MHPFLAKAMYFAVQMHDGQMRKDNKTPYWVHPIHVGNRLYKLEMPNEVVCAGYLHDVVEDCGISVSLIRHEFSHNVAKLVDWLTNITHGMKIPRAERKKIDRDRISKAPRHAKIIKLVDRIDNLNDLDSMAPEFGILYRKESLQLLDILKGTHIDLEKELEELCY